MEANCAESRSFQGQTLEGLLGRKRTAGGLLMAPMIDVIFLLLTFFIITAKFREPESFVPVALPSPDSAESIRGRMVEPLVLEITGRAGGCLARIGAEEAIDLSEEAPEAGLAAMAFSLNQICRSQGRTSEDPIELICHDEVSWDFVVKIYDVLQAMGASRITFVITEPGDEETQ